MVGVPGRFGDEEVWAFVIPEPGHPLTAQEVREFCRGVLEPYQVPQVVRVVEDFPAPLLASRRNSACGRSQSAKPQQAKRRRFGNWEVMVYNCYTRDGPIASREPNRD